MWVLVCRQQRSPRFLLASFFASWMSPHHMTWHVTQGCILMTWPDIWHRAVSWSHDLTCDTGLLHSVSLHREQEHMDIIISCICNFQLKLFLVKTIYLIITRMRCRTCFVKPPATERENDRKRSDISRIELQLFDFVDTRYKFFKHGLPEMILSWKF